VTTSRPLRILLAGDYPRDPRLGSSKVLYKLRDEFAALGHTCDVLFADEIGGPRSRQIRQLIAPWRAATVISGRMNHTPYDVVDVASAEGAWLGVLRRLGAHRRSVYICRSNGLEHLNYQRMLDDARAGLTSKPWPRRLWYPLSRLSQVQAAARLSDAMIVLNERDRSYVLDRGWLPEERVTVVQHGVSEAFLSPDAGRCGRGRGLLFCGTWDHIKGISYLSTAMDQLVAEGRRYPLTVLGPGVPADRVMASFREAVRPLVRVLPRADEAAVIAAYREHDVLLWTSSYEGFGLVLLEAMSQGLAVVATPAGCVPSIVRDGETGLVVPFRDAPAVAGAAARLMDEPALRDRLGAAARTAVSAMTWRASAISTLDVYSRALGAASRV